MYRLSELEASRQPGRIEERDSSAACCHQTLVAPCSKCSRHSVAGRSHHGSEVVLAEGKVDIDRTVFAYHTERLGQLEQLTGQASTHTVSTEEQSILVGRPQSPGQRADDRHGDRRSGCHELDELLSVNDLDLARHEGDHARRPGSRVEQGQFPDEVANTPHAQDCFVAIWVRCDQLHEARSHDPDPAGGVTLHHDGTRSAITASPTEPFDLAGGTLIEEVQKRSDMCRHSVLGHPITRSRIPAEREYPTRV